MKCCMGCGNGVNDHRDKLGDLQLGRACRIWRRDSRLLYRPCGSRENIAIPNIDCGIDIGMSFPFKYIVGERSSVDEKKRAMDQFAATIIRAFDRRA